MASEAVRGNMHMGTREVEVTKFCFEVTCDLRGHLEAAMASEGIKMAVVGNMHINTGVIKVADVKSEVI